MKKIDSLSNYQIVTIAIALLGGDSEHKDREDIALKADEIAPGKFSWRKYPDRIDLEAVSVAIRDAKKAKYGELVTGNTSRGWMLSKNGLRWILSLNQQEKNITQQLEEKKGAIAITQQNERDRLYRTRAYDLFASGEKEEISVDDFYQFVRINEYFKPKARERRYTLVDNAVSDDE